MQIKEGKKDESISTIKLDFKKKTKKIGRKNFFLKKYREKTFSLKNWKKNLKKKKTNGNFPYIFTTTIHLHSHPPCHFHYIFQYFT